MTWTLWPRDGEPTSAALRNGKRLLGWASLDETKNVWRLYVARTDDEAFQAIAHPTTLEEAKETLYALCERG